MINVFPIPAFEDNYIWCLQESSGTDCLVVDPGDASVVIDCLNERQLTLKGILVTHHHWDHTNGVEELLQHCSVPVYGPHNAEIKLVSHRVGDKDKIKLLDTEFEVITTPGHTLDHICYIAEPNTDSPFLFCGDTLFSAGCGRLFEGEPEQMFNSLNKLKQLPPQTRIYCTHEYTAANVRFALAVEPENHTLVQYAEEVAIARAEGRETLPVLMAQQLEVNPFLRTDKTSVIEAVIRKNGDGVYSGADVLRVIRQWKDNFQ
ncbi:hydroxyacylglutathione hydrolase [Endozoicomonas sp. OPT23]|nr:hydroxyacylglutathione hydrolase [Endozoicomonas sp. OPT23]